MAGPAQAEVADRAGAGRTGRVEESEEPLLNGDEPDVGVDEALSVGGAGCLGVPEGPFCLCDLGAGAVALCHVILALAGHVLDLPQGDGEASGDLLVLFSELLRGGDGVLPDALGDVVPPTKLNCSAGALLLEEDDLGAGVDIPAIALLELLAERPAEAWLLLGKSSIGFLGGAEVGGEALVGSALRIERVLEVYYLLDECDAALVDCPGSSANPGFDDVLSARLGGIRSVWE